MAQKITYIGMKIVFLSLLLTCFAEAYPSYASDNMLQDEDANNGKGEEMIQTPAKRSTQEQSKTVKQVVDQEAPWINVFIKHMALYKGISKTVGGVVINAHLYGMVAAVIFRLLKGEGGKGGLFGKIKTKVDERIRYQLNREKIQNAKKVFRHRISMIVVKMEWRKDKTKQYQMEDLLELRSYIADMLPISPNVDYDVEWFVWMAKYLILYKSFYDGLIQNNVVDKCVWVADWNSELKSSLKTAFTRLSYAYFSHLEKIGYGSPNWGTWITFKDSLAVPPKLYSEIVYTEVKAKVLQDLSAQAAKAIMENIGNSYNDLVSDADLEACGFDPADSRLTTENIEVEYPESCYGEGETASTKGQCELPCGKYGEEYTWCPYFHGRGIENENNKFYKNNNLLKCDDSPDYWRSCPPRVEEIHDIEKWDTKLKEMIDNIKKQKQKQELGVVTGK